MRFGENGIKKDIGFFKFYTNTNFGKTRNKIPTLFGKMENKNTNSVCALDLAFAKKKNPKSLHLSFS